MTHPAWYFSENDARAMPLGWNAVGSRWLRTSAAPSSCNPHPNVATMSRPACATAGGAAARNPPYEAASTVPPLTAIASFVSGVGGNLPTAAAALAEGSPGTLDYLRILRGSRNSRSRRRRRRRRRKF
eukprot:gene5965-biopygen1137